MKSKKITLLVFMLLVAVIFISSCAQQLPPGKGVTDVKSDKDVAGVIRDVSTDISNLTKELESIDESLG